jgi:putative transcriptional regulator
MLNYQSLQHIFLIAMPSMDDPFFSQAVVYLWEFNEKGAAGIVINKPMNLNLGQLLEQIEIDTQNSRATNFPVLQGGPVLPDQGFIIRRWESKDIHDESIVEITVSSSKEDLIDLAEGKGLDDSLVALGCAEWQPGQLDQELAKNDWLIAPFKESTLFGDLKELMSGEMVPALKWYSAAASAGIDLKRLSTYVGHS